MSIADQIRLPQRKVHVLKCWPEYFEEIGAGRKTFEVRKDDRDFRVGDMLHLQEFDPLSDKFTNRHLICLVSYKLNGPSFGIRAGHCVLAIRLPVNHIWPIENYHNECRK